MSIYVYVHYIYWSIIVEALFLYKNPSWTLFKQKTDMRTLYILKQGFRQKCRSLSELVPRGPITSMHLCVLSCISLVLFHTHTQKTTLVEEMSSRLGCDVSVCLCGKCFMSYL